MSELSSWKEIASYLGVTVRTAQKWERERGLPVRRLPGSRSVVRASIADVDAWRLQGLPTNGIPRSVMGRLVLWTVAAVVVLLAVGAAVHAMRKPLSPTTVALERNVLTALSDDGRVVWQRTFQALDAGYYRTGLPYVWVGDLDGDGRNEVLFTYSPMDSSQRAGETLYCFGSDGRERWHFVAGHPIRTATESFAPPFQVYSFAVFQTSTGKRVLVNSHHSTYYPAQISLLSPDGRVLGEYWHSGHLRFLQVADLEHSGHDEIFLAGVDNGEHQATLVVLDPDQVRGASAASDPTYQIQDMPLAHERARLLFPRGCMKDLYPYNVAQDLRVTNDGLIVGVREDLMESANGVVNYDLAPDVTVRRVDPSDTFYAVHAELAKAHRINHTWSPTELKDLAAVRNLTTKP